MDFYKFVTALIVAVLLWHMLQLWRLGRQMASERKDFRLEKPDEYLLARHRGAVACVGCITVLAVVLIEMQVRMSPSPYSSGPLLMAFHLLVVGLLVAVFFAIVLKWRGVEYPLLHRRLAYSFFGLYAAVITTGAVLLYRLPS